jgi:hypothetical protein
MPNMKAAICLVVAAALCGCGQQQETHDRVAVLESNYAVLSSNVEAMQARLGRVSTNTWELGSNVLELIAVVKSDEQTNAAVALEMHDVWSNFASRYGPAAEAVLNKLQITRSFYYLESGSRPGESTPVVALSVYNTSDVPIFWATFRVTLTVPGKATPFLDDSFMQKIAGGLAPGKTETIKIHIPTSAVSSPPAEAALTAKVQQILGPDGNPIF